MDTAYFLFAPLLMIVYYLGRISSSLEEIADAMHDDEVEDAE